MRATLEFDLPDDDAEHRAALLGGKALSVLWQLDQRCRAILKHGDPCLEAAALAGEIRDIIRERCPESLEI